MPVTNSPIIFSHANSFGASTYSVLFKALWARGFTLQAVDQFGHDPRYPVTCNWPHLVQQVIDLAQREVDRLGTPIWLVGHSLGGFLSLMAAAKAPALARGVLLLDSPIVGGWRARILAVAKRTQLVAAISAGVARHKRRTQWPDLAAALAHFQGKRNFAKWHPQVLHDYILHGTHEDATNGDTRLTLRFERDVETAIYKTLPHNMEAMLKQHPLSCPVAFIGGTRSIESKHVGMALTHRVTKGRVMLLDGSHLFPMERPLVTAVAIEAALLNLSISG